MHSVTPEAQCGYVGTEVLMGPFGRNLPSLSGNRIKPDLAGSWAPEK